ncbi:MAG: peptidoglycan-binding domain-containing protein [Gammaproteobacteria bacterium]|jgi:peptidoglycan hydrolase-like protein with peptidoglycan-binding domain
MIRKIFPIALLFASLVSGVARADALTQIIQQDLATLGYDPGNTDGEESVETAVAISKFQAENGLEVTGKATPQLAGVIKATISRGDAPSSVAKPVAQPSQQAAVADGAIELQAARQACLQQKAAERQESQQRKRGFARLARAVTRTASRLGGDSLSSGIIDLSSGVYEAGAIASDFKGAAEDLGLTESDIEECRNPL